MARTCSRPEARGGSWRADETIVRLVADGQIPPLLLLAIDHGDAKRMHEFTPTLPSPRLPPPR